MTKTAQSEAWLAAKAVVNLIGADHSRVPAVASYLSEKFERLRAPTPEGSEQVAHGVYVQTEASLPDFVEINGRRYEPVASTIADQMRAVADWCSKNVHRIPVQTKTRAPGELPSLLDHLAEYVESGQAFDEADVANLEALRGALEEIAAFGCGWDRSNVNPCTKRYTNRKEWCAPCIARRALSQHVGGEG